MSTLFAKTFLLIFHYLFYEVCVDFCVLFGDIVCLSFIFFLYGAVQMYRSDTAQMNKLYNIHFPAVPSSALICFRLSNMVDYNRVYFNGYICCTKERTVSCGLWGITHNKLKLIWCLKDDKNIIYSGNIMRLYSKWVK